MTGPVQAFLHATRERRARVSKNICFSRFLILAAPDPSRPSSPCAFARKASVFSKGAVSLKGVSRAAPFPARRAVSVAPRAMLQMGPSAAPTSLDGFGDHCFRGAVAKKYLSKYGESDKLLDDTTWPTQPGKADILSLIHI